MKYPMLHEAQRRFFGGTLPDFDRPETLAYSLVLAQAILFIGLFYLSEFSYEEAIAYLPSIEIGLLINMALLSLSSHYVKKHPRLNRRLRYSLLLLLPCLTTIILTIFSLCTPFIPISSPRAIFLSNTLLLWSIMLMAECQYARLTPSLAEARLQALQNRIHPHFLFNSLNSVLALIPSQPAQAEQLLEDMCELFRAILEDHHSTVSITQELEWCKRYLSIEQIRLGERMILHWESPHQLPAVRVPPLLIQPLIENAITHGISLVGGVLYVGIVVHPRRLAICIKNPLPQKELGVSGHHLALENIRQRLALYFGEKAVLNTQRSSHEYQTDLTLPY